MSFISFVRNGLIIEQQKAAQQNINSDDSKSTDIHNIDHTQRTRYAAALLSSLHRTELLSRSMEIGEDFIVFMTFSVVD